MDFATLAQECAPWVAHETMAAIVRTESAFRPLTIGVNGGAKLARQPENKAEAVATAKWLIGNGYNVDLGLGQINSSNLVKTGLTVEDAFEPCKNLAAAASILHWNYQAASRKAPGGQATLHAALSAYNTGSFTKGFANGYVQKVLNNAGTASAVSTVSPIALVSTQASKRQPARQAVKLKAEGPAEQPTQDGQISVYSDSTTQPRMVY
ncbi:conjugal transfer protein [Verminephrobacter aporrectodeae subsp. tuberculatae]|uniref:lytic transglycosylase domain-containing protein n=1 Tax=Verminephrobacter aporrectodeae TaxID=1110389 RepID=UPI0004960D71|nr:lytic transglycosylase domain-containing protein [Verminephrobacter aporrectodeae]MCW8167078.1 conjugal transfer protein [Verminephrobacter aporrectodeae subsp. tuberculatae]MCW8171241.1 conjugal transfer protein [Verminephrobacter aporrectodeae subsp. tuberculatae]